MLTSHSWSWHKLFTLIIIQADAPTPKNEYTSQSRLFHLLKILPHIWNLLYIFSITGIRYSVPFFSIPWFEIVGDYPSLSKLSVFMRPQRIVSNLSLNVIIHLEMKLNCKQILKNTCLPMFSIYILVVLCYKNEQKISFTYHHNMKKTNINPRIEIIMQGSMLLT